MKLEKYIRKLLPIHETVIIPGFGAFVTHYKPAEIDEDSDEMLPPSKTVEFNSKIRNNDGLLVGTIAEKEGISHFEALQKIEKERDNMLYKLDKNETVTLEKIGSFNFGKNREIQFEPADTGNLLLDAYGLEPTSATTRDTISEETSEPEKEPENTETSPGGQPQKAAEPEEESTGKIPSKEENAEAAFAGNDPGGRKNRGWPWFLLILIPLAVGGILILKKKQQTTETEVSKEPVLNDSLVAEEKPVPEKDTATVDSLAAAPADSISRETEKPTDSTNYLTPDPSKYYLVGGSFTQKENAEEFLVKLKNQGYDAFHLGKQGNFYIIGIGIYETERAAFAAQYDFLEKYPESGVWVYNVKQMNSGNY